MKIPVYESKASLQPTAMNPEVASRVGKEIVDVSKGLAGIAVKVKEMNDDRQILKAQISLIDVDKQNWQLAATDPDLDKVSDRIKENTTRGLTSSANLISSPDARNKFMSEATLDMDRKNLRLDQHIFTRQSDDIKQKVTDFNSQQVEAYKDSADKSERMLIKQKSYEYTMGYAQKGWIHGSAAKDHLDKLWKKAEIDQVMEDASITGRAEEVARQLEKGKEGLYSDLSDHERMALHDKVTKQIKKEGIENNYIGKIAQNHTDNILLDKMADHTLTMKDIDDARIGAGEFGHPATPEFAKAAQQALEDPIPTGTTNEQRLQAYNIATDTSIDPVKARTEIFKIRGLSAGEKTKIANWGLREDDGGTKRSLNYLVQDGLKKNRQELLERNNQVQEEIKQRRSWLGGVMDFFKQNSSEEDSAKMFKEFIDQKEKVKTQEEAANVAKGLLKKNIMENHPETMSLDDTPNIVGNFKDGVKSVWSAPSNANANYEIKNGRVVPKGSSDKAVSKYKNGQEINIKGKKYRVLNDSDDPDIEIMK
jgi:hypothetical protein